MKQMKTISFIIPIYNQEEFIGEYLDSLCALNLENYEIICVNDGSVDQTRAILDKYAAENEKIRVFHIENHGPGYARNYGIDKSEAKYITFCDADDKVNIATYEMMYQKMVDEELELLVANYEEVFDSGKINQKCYKFESAEDHWALVRGLIAVYGKIYLKEFIQKNDIYFPETYQGEDRVFLAKLLVAKPKMNWIDDIAYYYMRHEEAERSTLTHSYDYKYFEQRMNSWKEFYRICSKSFPKETETAILNGMSYHYPFWRRLRLEEKTKGLLLLRELLGLLRDIDKHQRVFGMYIKDFMEVAKFEDYAQKRIPNRLGVKSVNRMERREPQISIIMPIYNVGKYIAQCLYSITTQTYEDFEIICVDDGSEDDTIEIIHEFMEIDKRISLITQSHQMAGVARNNGMKVAKGNYYLFLDGDDFFEKDMLKNTYEQIVKDDADVCVFGARMYFESSGQYRPAPRLLMQEYIPEQIPFEGKTYPYLFNMTNANPWNKLIKKSLVDEHKLQFMPLERCNDVYFIFMVMALAQRITIDNNVYVNYRQVSTSLQANNDRSPLDWYKAVTELKRGLSEKGIYNNVEQSFVNCALSISIYNLFSLKKGSNFVQVYNELKESKFEELGILNREEDYFYPYNKENYKKFLAVVETDVCDYLYDELRRANGGKDYWMKRAQQGTSKPSKKSIIHVLLNKMRNLRRYSAENGSRAAWQIVKRKVKNKILKRK